MEYDFKFTQQEMQILVMALGELPAKHSLALIAKLQVGQKQQDEAKAIPIDALQATAVATNG